MISKFIVCYYILINLASFSLMYIDKRKSKKRKTRISEKNLLIPGLIGGVIGIILGMKIFHHKTRKLSFKFAVLIILILNSIYLYFIWYYFEII